MNIEKGFVYFMGKNLTDPQFFQTLGKASYHYRGVVFPYIKIDGELYLGVAEVAEEMKRSPKPRDRSSNFPF